MPALPPPPPQITGGRGTILSQEARLHALQIAEEIQAERGSYRKWNEVAKAVNRQYGSNVDGDLVKRQVTSMLRSVQRSGLNSVKRPRKHAEVIQQLLDPVAKRQGIEGPDGIPLRIRGEDDDGVDGEGRGDIINVEVNESDRGSNTGSESGTPPGSPSRVAAQAAAAAAAAAAGEVPITTFDAEGGANTTTTTTTSSSPSASLTSELGSTPTKSSDPEKAKSSASEAKKKTSANIKAHQIKFKQQQMPAFHSTSIIPLQPQPIAHFAPAPVRVLPTMNVEEVYNLLARLHPDIDAEFIKTQEIDGSAYQALTHKELADFGVNTFGKRNKLLQLCVNFDQQSVVTPPANQDFFYGRLPNSFAAPGFIEAKAEPANGEKHDMKESSEKKPPVTKVLDLEVVGVRKRYLIERENGAVEVLTPCKLRKYKNLTASFEHLHPDKLIPIPSFSTPFTHVPNNAEEKSTDSPATDSSPRTGAKNKAGKSPAKSQGAFIPPSAYFPVAYYPQSYIASPSGTAHPSPNLQWVSTPYPGVSQQRTPEKYHSFHPYTPPQK